MNVVHLEILEDGRQVANIMCPGCHFTHRMVVKTPNTSSPHWSWNESMDRPTFQPSILARYGHYAKGSTAPTCDWCKEDDDKDCCGVCHSFVTDGVIQFLDDCTHSLAGQSVPLKQYPSPEDL